jgi:hypothetical protein
MSKSPAEETRAARSARRQKEIQRQLDEALEGSFPASDPVSIVTSGAEEDWAEEPGEGDAADPAGEATEPSAREPSPPGSRSSTR